MDFFSALTLLFVTLKLCSVIDWSWVWVLAPTWMSLTVFVVAYVVSEWDRRV